MSRKLLKLSNETFDFFTVFDILKSMSKPTVILLVIVVVAIFALAGYYFGYDVGFEKSAQISENEETMPANTLITLHTNKGDIGIELFTDKMPITAGNFLKLAQESFYDGTKFHRVISGFMIQGGDPNSKGDDLSLYGRGGPGFAIKDEFVAGFSNVRGTISMANSGPGTGGSQFFINVADNIGLDYDKEPLASKHPVFGKVISGMDVVDAIAKTPTGVGDVPLEPVVINSVSVSK